MNLAQRALARANRRLASLEAEPTAAQSREMLLLRGEIEGIPKPISVKSNLSQPS